MKKTFMEKISDITHLHKRAAFTDLPEQTGKESVFRALARDRYSCRAFKDTPLTDEQIGHILEAARLAPTAANKQPVHVWVGSFDPAKIKADFPETEGYEVVCLFPVGVAVAGASPKHHQRQPLETFASEL